MGGGQELSAGPVGNCAAADQAGRSQVIPATETQASGSSELASSPLDPGV